MIDIHISNETSLPLYRQIEEQIKQLIATERLRPGERLPSVRELSQTLEVNPATVARAYQDLEQEGILGTHRRRGTVVTGIDKPANTALRRNHLSNLINTNITQALSLGYSPDEIEADFSLQLARWRIERETKAEAEAAPVTDRENTIVIVGSHDLALTLLISHLKIKHPEILVKMTSAGSLGGLLAILEDKADLAGIHLLDEETGEYNQPYVKHVLQDIPVAIVHLAYRHLGLMYTRGNPKNITGLDDLRRSDISFVNRQKGAGTRVVLDYWLRQRGIAPQEIKGYSHEVDTHLSVATAIARGEVDCGLGIEAAARSSDVDFLHLTSERFDMVIPKAVLHSRKIEMFLGIVKSSEFKKVVAEMGGYDTSQTGTTTFIE